MTYPATRNLQHRRDCRLLRSPSQICSRRFSKTSIVVSSTWRRGSAKGFTSPATAPGSMVHPLAQADLLDQTRGLGVIGAMGIGEADDLLAEKVFQPFLAGGHLHALRFACIARAATDARPYVRRFRPGRSLTASSIARSSSAACSAEASRHAQPSVPALRSPRFDLPATSRRSPVPRRGGDGACRRSGDSRTATESSAGIFRGPLAEGPAMAKPLEDDVDVARQRPVPRARVPRADPTDTVARSPRTPVATNTVAGTPCFSSNGSASVRSRLPRLRCSKVTATDLGGTAPAVRRRPSPAASSA